MSNLKLFMMHKDGVTTQLVVNPNWEWMGFMSHPTVYFHTEPSTHEFVGELFLKNYTINFMPFTSKVEIPDGKTVFFLVRHEPDGLWIDGQRWAIPAKESI